MLPWSLETRLKPIYHLVPARDSAHVVVCVFVFNPSSHPEPRRPGHLAWLSSLHWTEWFSLFFIFSCLPFGNSLPCVLTTPPSRLIIFCQIILHTYAYNCTVMMIIASTWDCHNYFCYTVVELVFCSITSGGNTREPVSPSLQAPPLPSMETSLPCVIASLAICCISNDIRRKIGLDLCF